MNPEKEDRRNLEAASDKVLTAVRALRDSDILLQRIPPERRHTMPDSGRSLSDEAARLLAESGTLLLEITKALGGNQ